MLVAYDNRHKKLDLFFVSIILSSRYKKYSFSTDTKNSGLTNFRVAYAQKTRDRKFHFLKTCDSWGPPPYVISLSLCTAKISNLLLSFFSLSTTTTGSHYFSLTFSSLSKCRSWHGSGQVGPGWVAEVTSSSLTRPP
jgi:hypothetical protein